MTIRNDAKNLIVIYKPLSEIKKYAKNARTHSVQQVSEIAASIEEFGWTNPVLVDEQGEIIAGHGRVQAAEQLEIDQVPVIVLAGLTDAQKRAYRLADNRLPLNAGWDDELLKLEIEDLLSADFDIRLAGFELPEIDDLLTNVQQNNSDTPYTAKIDTPVYQPSDTVPAVTELYDEEKTNRLRERIVNAELPPDIEKFLLSAAERHTIFNFNKIADYYASATPEIQALFEESALIIIDYEQAIEHGFVHLTQKMIEIVHGEVDDDA